MSKFKISDLYTLMSPNVPSLHLYLLPKSPPWSVILIPVMYKVLTHEGCHEPESSWTTRFLGTNFKNEREVHGPEHLHSCENIEF